MQSTILITAYSNPDLDGVACAIAYGELMKKKGKAAKIAFFGTPHREAQFVFNKFKIPQPLDAEKLITKTTPVVIVDASDLRGISDKIDPKQVVKIIDHRQIHQADQFPNATAHIELVGACATLIAEKFFYEKIDISETSAALLYSAIVSNTVNFKASVTTSRDKKMAKVLLDKFSLPDDYTHKMFSTKSDFNKPLLDVFEDDCAIFKLGSYKMCIVQLEITSASDFVKHNYLAIYKALKKIKGKKQANIAFLSIVDIEKERNIFITTESSTQKLLSKALGVVFKKHIAFHKGILMRKTIVPIVKQILEKNFWKN